jgi:hypothetical protein
VASVSDILTAVNDELELNISSDETAKRKVLRWINSIYSEVVNSAEFPWRKKDAVLSTVAPITGGATFVSGSTSFAFQVIPSGSYSYNYGYLLADGYDLLYALKPTMYPNLGSMEQAWQGTSGSISATLYAPRYNVGSTAALSTMSSRLSLREDWITGVYCQSDSAQSSLLPRIYPTSYYDYVMYSIKNPSKPQAWYTYGVDAYKNVLICFSPAPDDVYSYNIAYMLGATTLVETDSSTILPPEFEMDVFINGCGMLHAINRKEPEGMQLYGSRFRNIVDTMMARTARNPGGSSRVCGYIVRHTKEWDPDLPLEGYNF